MTEAKGITGQTPMLLSILQAAPQLQHLMLYGPRLQAALLRAAVAQQKETTAFVAKRCDEDLKLADKIMVASSVSDVFGAFLTFWHDAAAQYVREGAQSTEVHARNALGICSDLRGEVSAAAATVTPIRRAA
jgi:hypothetical protein